jgi:hypothetical protein
MRNIGFSTGALARGDVHRALQMMQHKPLQAIELSALRQNELAMLVNQIDELELSQFRYISVHAPSSLDPEFEPEALKLLELVSRRGWPIVVHPDAVHRVEEWARFGDLLLIENMDKRKPIGQTAADLAAIFGRLPDAMLCLDLGHARQIDPTMSEATAIFTRFAGKLKQLHISEVSAQSKHDPLTLEAIMAFQRVASFIPQDIPVILESRVEESQIELEIRNASAALDATNILALAGD